MARKMMVLREDGSSPVLTEAPGDNEVQLQGLIKVNRDLGPIDEFGMSGPPLAVGREATLPPDGVDLVDLAWVRDYCLSAVGARRPEDDSPGI